MKAMLLTFYFNSTMVRLKATFPIPELDSVGNFNSTMVRLKVLC